MQTDETESVERTEQGRTSQATLLAGAKTRTPIETGIAQDALQSEEVPMNINDIEPTSRIEHEADVRVNSRMSLAPDQSRQPELTILDILEDE